MGPESPSLKDLLTQLLAVLPVDRFSCQPFRVCSAAEIFLLQGHVPSFPGAVHIQGMINVRGQSASHLHPLGAVVRIRSSSDLIPTPLLSLLLLVSQALFPRALLMDELLCTTCFLDIKSVTSHQSPRHQPQSRVLGCAGTVLLLIWSCYSPQSVIVGRIFSCKTSPILSV